MRLVFWQNLLSFYQVPHLTALAADPDVDVTWVVERIISPDRVAQGWKVPEVRGVKVVVAPDRAAVRDLVCLNPGDSVHIFSGIYQQSTIRSAFYACVKTSARIGMLTEPPVPGPLRDLLSPFIHGVHHLFYGRRLNFILAIGPEAVKFYQSIGYPASRVFPYGYFPAAPSSAAPSSAAETAEEVPAEEVPAEEVQILYLGQLIERKGVDILLKALAPLSGLPWALTIIGTGTQKDALKALGKRLGLEKRVIFQPALENDAAMRLMEQSDLFVLPSRHDGWGVVINEALLRGVPVICSDHCGASDLLDEPWRGETFVSESVSSLSQVLQRWIARGKRAPQETERLRRWSRCIEGESAAAYLLGAIRSTLAEGPRPQPPWHKHTRTISQNNISQDNISFENTKRGGSPMPDDMPAPRGPRRILILQRILPPYRLAFFQALAGRPKFDLTLACGQASKESALESLTNPEKVRTQLLVNRYFGKNERFIIQSGSLALLRTKKYDVVIAEFNPRIVTNVLACLSARRRGLKFIWWGHGFRPNSGAADRGIYLFLARLADALIFYSAAGADSLIGQGLPKEKAFVAWNSINLEEIDGLSEQTSPRARTRILYIGRLIAEKKVALLFRAFALAADRLDPGATLTVIGDGPERAALDTLARQLGISDRVEFVGSVYRQAALAPYFNTAWVSVSPGYVGLSAIHSLAYGVPMLVADREPHSPEIAAIEEGVNAVFFDSDDAEALCQALIKLAGDPAKQQAMSRTARQTVRQRFSIEGMVQAFDDAICYAEKDHALKTMR